MTGPTVTYRTTLRRQPESRLTALPEALCTAVPPRGATAQAPAPATPIARLLAMAHHIERLVDAGELKDYAKAGRRLGMCKSHVTHIINLLQLAPDIQEAILMGRVTRSESTLRGVCRQYDWAHQRLPASG